MSDHEALAREARERLDRWLAALARAPREGYRMIADLAELPRQARADSCYWCDRIFAPEANPLDAPGAKHGYHVARGGAPDLLRHEYAARGLGITVVEGRNFVRIGIDRRSLDVLALPAEARAEAIHRAAAALLHAPHGRCAPSFTLPEELREGARFCTEGRADPLLLSCWTERVEGGIHGGEVFFVCYKKPAQRTGFAGAEAWFDADFRAKAQGSIASCRAGPLRSRRARG